MPERSGIRERESVVNLTIQKAFVDDVKNRGEDPEEQILGVDIKLTAEVPPSTLDEFSPEIGLRLFNESGAPTITELGRCRWRTEYEKGEMTIAGHKVLGTGIINVTFEPMLNGVVQLKLWARCTPDQALAGALAMLIKQEVKVTFKKMTQVPLIKEGSADGEEEGEEDGQQEIPQITPLLTTEKLNEAARGKKH